MIITLDKIFEWADLIAKMLGITVVIHEQGYIKSAQGMPVWMDYDPATKQIRIWAEQLIHDMQNVVSQNPTIDEEKCVKVIKKLINHEKRHSDQHQWLIMVFGEEKGTRMFLDFYNKNHYAHNPLEIDARKAEKNHCLPIGQAMILVLGKESK